MDENAHWGAATQGIRAAEPRTAEMEHSAAVHLTSSYVFESAADAAAVFAGEKPGNVYSRFTNPTVQAFEKRLAILEGGDACIATASGMSAILSVFMALLRSGDHVVASRTLFGATINLFNNVIGKFGIDTTFVDPSDIAGWGAAMRGNTRLLFVETPNNPLTNVADIAALAEIAHASNSVLVVDNCFLTPVLQQPLKLGADIVVHSATKYLDGQGRCVGGAVVGDAQRVGKDVFAFMRTAGPAMSPFNAWVFLKGLETLALRVQAHSQSALTLARWLREQAGVTHVYYPGLEDHPQHDLALRQHRSCGRGADAKVGHGGIVSFEVEGGRDAAWRVIDAVRMISITANLGDTRSTITHPATTTHGRISAEAKALAGIRENLVRVAVGLENVEDLMVDLGRGLRR